MRFLNSWRNEVAYDFGNEARMWWFAVQVDVRV
jgi:hypothetical protein